MKIFNKLLILLCMSALLISAVPAASAQESPLLYFTDCTVYTGGSSSYCYLRMSNAENISAMDYIITYDSDNLTLSDIYQTGFTSQSDVTVSVNRSEPGIIRVTLISQNGLNGSAYLNLMYFKAKANAAEGKYPISVLVNDIYNSSLETVAVSKQDGNINVKKSSQVVKNVSFSNSVSVSSMKIGESVNYILNAGSLNGLSAGTFDFAYDETRLKFDEITLSESMKNTVYDTNSSNRGLVKLSFASETAITSGSRLVTLRFSAIAPGTAEISFKPSDLYDNEFNGMTGSKLSKSVTIEEPEIVPDYPDFKLLVPENVLSDKEFTIPVVLEGGSGVRAGDFTVCYDAEILECLNVEKGSIKGAWVVTDKDYSGGKIRFSLMSNEDIEEDTILISLTLKSKENTDSKSTISVSGTGVYDADFNAVTLEYIGAKIRAIRPEYTVNFYDSDGQTLISSQSVKSGNSAISPEVTEIRKSDGKNHLKFSGWDKDYSVITENIDLTAVYTEEAHTSVIKPGYSPGCDTPGRTDETYCVVCGEILKQSEEIRPTGARLKASLDSDGTLNISGAISDSAAAEYSVILGIYGGSKLLNAIDISEQNQANINLKIAGMPDADFVKLFRWNSLADIQPVYGVSGIAAERQ